VFFYCGNFFSIYLLKFFLGLFLCCCLLRVLVVFFKVGCNRDDNARYFLGLAKSG